MFFQPILHVPPGLFVRFHFGFGTTICADHQMSKTELGDLICMFPQEDREKRPVQVSGLQCAEKKSNADCYIGTVHFLFHSFFVWHIDALTQFILINMNSINMCSRTLTNTLKEQLCEFAKRAFTNMYTSKEIRLKLSVFTVMVMYMLTQWYIQHYHRTSFYTIIKSTNRSTLLHKMRIGRIYLHWLAFT